VALPVAVLGLAAAPAAPGPSVLAAQEESSAGVAALELPVGARAIGMGRAYVAIDGDLQGLLYNPAGLASRDSTGLTFSRYEGASDLDLNGNYGAASLPVGRGAFTVALNYEDLGEIELTGSSPEPLGTVDLRNLLLVGSYAVQLVPRVALGASAKYLSSDLGAAEGSGVAFDAGALIRPSKTVPLTLGLAVLNVGPDLELDLDEAGGEEPEGDPLPSRLRWGAAVDLRSLAASGAEDAGDGDLGLTLSADLEHDLRELGNVSVFAGAALGYRDILTVRGGALRLENGFGEEASSGAALGAGVRWEGVRVDVARELGVNEAGDETHFSIGVDF
jgi:hypothetical protein